MKKILYSFFALSLFLVSCSTDENLVTTSLTESIQSYVSDNYPDVTVDAIETTGTNVTATLSSGEQLTFSRVGSFISYANNAESGLSTDSLVVTTDSVATDSVGDKHHHHGDGHGKGHHKGGGKGGDDHHKGYQHGDNDLSVDSLSTTINDYLSANYSGYKVINAKTDTICEGVVTNVMICDSVSEPVKLVFDANGAFLMSSTRMDYADVPEAISTAITTNYSTYTVSGRCSLYTLADGSLQYKVYFKKKKQHLWVRLAADGTLVCSKL